MAKLEEYRRKRDFQHTTEPAGKKRRKSSSDRRYVMHKHAASHDHFDLRLEQDGVLRSWALPKGPSLMPGEKRLAVEVEDHPLEYGDFEGVIPEEAYGGGTVMLWDRGHWQISGKQRRDRIDFTLKGEKLQGIWTLTRMTGRQQKSDKHWLMIRHRDDERHDGDAGSDDDRSVVSGRSMQQIAEDRDSVKSPHEADDANDSEENQAPSKPGSLEGARKQALPREVSPQLATLVRDAPEGSEWIHEVKFDGYRIMARVEHGSVTLVTRNNKDWTHRFPELARRLAQLPVERVLLDGEVVSLARDGTSSFRRLQEALSDGRTRGLTFQVFDLLHLDGRDLSRVALTSRKEALRQLLAATDFDLDGHVRYSDHIDAQGPAFFEQACRIGLEGIISKRATSQYHGTRSKQWLKVKCANHEEFVIGGYTEPGGSRSGFGALLIGAFEENDKLAYTGRVGTGFSTRQLESLSTTLSGLERKTSPFNGTLPNTRSVHWVRPRLVIEVEFTERTRDGRLRHPAFRGLREDRNPEEIRVTRHQKTTSSRTSSKSSNATTRRSTSRAGETQDVLGVHLTHADRVMYPQQGLTKLDLARYYEEIQDWILPHLIRRPLALVRCPEGHNRECFFQKHPRVAIPDRVPRIDIPEKEGTAEYLYVESAPDLVALVQAGALEIHPWGSRIDDLERPDNLVFDLDPAPGVAWKEILNTAATLRDRLDTIGLTSFVRVTGGKGVHLVVPITPQAEWDEVKAFAKAIAEQHAREAPSRLTINMSKAKRQGRIFIDYLRNSRGATAVASYSVRAREGAPVCVPVRWNELSDSLSPNRYTVENLRRRLSALREDPWTGFADASRPITARMRKAVGLD